MRAVLKEEVVWQEVTMERRRRGGAGVMDRVVEVGSTNAFQAEIRCLSSESDLTSQLGPTRTIGAKHSSLAR